jgi:hypothetical protein
MCFPERVLLLKHEHRRSPLLINTICDYDFNMPSYDADVDRQLGRQYSLNGSIHVHPLELDVLQRWRHARSGRNIGDCRGLDGGDQFMSYAFMMITVSLMPKCNPVERLRYVLTPTGKL